MADETYTTEGARAGALPWHDLAATGNWLQAGYLQEANRLAGIDNERRGFLRSEFDRNTQDVATDRDVNRMYAGLSNQASRDSLVAQKNARQFLGESGITGGGYSGHLGSVLELQRLGQLTQARAGTRQWQMEQNAAARTRRMQAAFGVAEGSAPSMINLDAMSDVLGLNVTMQGIKAQSDAARQASRDARRGGALGTIGNIFQGVLGLAL